MFHKHVEFPLACLDTKECIQKEGELSPAQQKTISFLENIHEKYQFFSFFFPFLFCLSLFMIHFFVSLAFLFLSFLAFRLGTKECRNANKGLLPLEELTHFLRLSLHSVLNSWIEVSLLSNSAVTELLVQRGLGQRAP